MIYSPFLFLTKNKKKKKNAETFFTRSVGPTVKMEILSGQMKNIPEGF